VLLEHDKLDDEESVLLADRLLPDRLLEDDWVLLDERLLEDSVLEELGVDDDDSVEQEED